METPVCIKPSGAVKKQPGLEMKIQNGGSGHLTPEAVTKIQDATIATLNFTLYAAVSNDNF